jgi:hypothetical protein
LQDRLRRAQLAHPKEAFGVEGAAASELVEDPSTEENYDMNSEGRPIPTPSEVIGRRGLKAQFGRKRTHNEQLFVAPCGVILARETFYNAEAIGSVIVSESCSFFYFEN